MPCKQLLYCQNISMIVENSVRFNKVMVTPVIEHPTVCNFVACNADDAQVYISYQFHLDKVDLLSGKVKPLQCLNSASKERM